MVFYTVKNTVKTQIGSPVTTNTNGIAICDYVGSGMGDIAIMAETEIDGRILQEIYEVLDCLFYDKGVTGTETVWFKENRPSVDILSDGTVLSNTVNQNKYLWAVSPLITPSGRADCINFTPSFNVEFIVIETTGNCYLNIGDGVSSDRNRTMGQFGITGNNHIKVEVRSDSIRYYKDGTELSNLAINNITQLISRVGLFVQQNASVKFKDFKIYPI